METLLLWLWPFVVFGIVAGVGLVAMRRDPPRHSQPGE